MWTYTRRKGHPLIERRCSSPLEPACAVASPPETAFEPGAMLPRTSLPARSLSSRRAALDRLALALADGLWHELVLTPKPGLVDLEDSGSHPDLTFDLMVQSIGSVRA